MSRSKFVGAPMGPSSNTAQVSKQEFGRRVQQHLLRKGWKQSDLARAAFGQITNSEGYKVAKNREMISQFVNGKAFPSPLTLDKIAKALGVGAAELLPQINHQAIENDSEPEFEFKVAQGKGYEGLLRINRIVSLDQFSRIVAILQESDESASAKKR